MAFILGGRTSNGLAFTRSLGRKGIPVVAIDTVKGPGSRSRYCVSVEASGSTASEGELLAFLDRAGGRLRTQAVLIPTADEYVLFVSRHRAVLKDRYAFVIAGEATLESILDKKAQYLQAARLSIPIPQTYFMEGQGDIHTVARAVSYPCIIKPASSYQWSKYRQRAGIQGWLKLAHADSYEELIRSYTEMARSGIELMVQERIGEGMTRSTRSTPTSAGLRSRWRSSCDERCGNGQWTTGTQVLRQVPLSQASSI